MDKQTLRQYRYLVKEIEQIEEEKSHLADGLIGAVNISDMPHAQSKIHDPMAEVACKMADLSRRMAKKLNEVIALRTEIEQSIDGLEDARDRVLMRSRYIDCKKWEQIAVDMVYDYHYVLELHGEILNKMSQSE
jgi:hypothetical protein